MIILGINAFHADASAAIVNDGALIAAAEEERFRRIKHWAGFPSQSIAYCLAEAGISIHDVDHIAINQNNVANLGRRIAYMLRQRPELRVILRQWRTRQKRVSVPDSLAEAFPGARLKSQFHKVEHHMAHLSSAFHVSPFEEASVASVDGFGDFASAAWGIGHGTSVDIEDRVIFPHSLGLFYQALTQYLGFPNYGDEYKVMGLAAYGKPARLVDMRKIVLLKADGSFELDLSFFRHHKERIDSDWRDGIPHYGDLFTPALETLLGPRRGAMDLVEPRHHDIARSIQEMYEEAFFNLLRRLYEKHQSRNIALAGGCAMNSVANGKIRRLTNFDRVYVQSAAGDAGGAIGAAFVIWHRLGGERHFRMDHAFWGPHYGREEIHALLDQQRSRIAEARCTIEEFYTDDDLFRSIAAHIANGDIVGWFQGRMEWGPRALGNRSILGDPRRADMKDVLNLKIKRRESFRPFAPSVLAEEVSEWFEESDDVPFMMQVFQIRKQKRSQIPAVTHIDGSGRLQTVTKAANSRYHALISEFHKLTGVPMVLNTSFNENEPIVCQPQEALDCFLRTNMDVLVLGDVVIRREHKTAKHL